MEHLSGEEIANVKSFAHEGTTETQTHTFTEAALTVRLQRVGCVHLIRGGGLQHITQSNCRQLGLEPNVYGGVVHLHRLQNKLLYVLHFLGIMQNRFKWFKQRRCWAAHGDAQMGRLLVGYFYHPYDETIFCLNTETHWRS